MANEITMIDILVQTHVGLERLGPGSPEMVMKALSFIDNQISHAADMGCGTGGQTMILAQHIAGKITGVDIFPEFINVFNDNAERLNLSDRVTGIVGSMDSLPFEKKNLTLFGQRGL